MKSPYLIYALAAVMVILMIIDTANEQTVASPYAAAVLAVTIIMHVYLETFKDSRMVLDEEGMEFIREVVIETLNVDPDNPDIKSGG